MIRDAQAERLEALRKEMEERRDRVAVMVTDDLIYDLVGQETQNIAAEEMR